jgi:hypothetical protein
MRKWNLADGTTFKSLPQLNIFIYFFVLSFYAKRKYERKGVTNEKSTISFPCRPFPDLRPDMIDFTPFVGLPPAVLHYGCNNTYLLPLEVTGMIQMKVLWQSGNGANFSTASCAFLACATWRTAGVKLSFGYAELACGSVPATCGSFGGQKNRSEAELDEVK